MSDPYMLVVTAAAELKRSNLDGYERLVKSIQALAEHTKTALVACEPGFLMIHQGKAQALVELAKKLEDCAVLHAQYTTRR